MSTSDDILLVERRDNVLWLSLNRPERRNALNEALIGRLAEVFAQVSDAAGPYADLRAIVMTGTGDKAFCSGADLNPQAATFGFDYSRPRSAYAQMLRAARNTTVPLIARVNGFCLAGGMGLLAVCDMAVAASTARFGLPEVKVGLFPMQVAALMQPMLPPRKFAEMCYTGEMLSADEALACGLVNHVAEPDALDARLDALLERVTSNSPAAIRRGKYALTATAGMTFEQAMSFMESQLGLMPMTEDAAEGLAAFAQKRAPNWTGR